MSSNAQFWLGVNIIIGFVLLTLVGLTTNYWKHHNELVAEMIKNGTSPVEVMCAMQDDYGTHPTCLILATKHKP